MLETLKSHLHPLGGRIIFWNFVLLLAVKVIIPHSALQSASLLGLTPSFDSREIINETNQIRIGNNLSTLTVNTRLDLAASDKLNDMAMKEYFAHVSPTGVEPWYWIKNAQYKYSVAGENLAIGFFSAKDTVQAWLNSPSHKANLLSTNYREIGVAVKTVEINGREGILVVQMFGSPSPGPVANIPKTPAPTPRLALNSPTPVDLTPQTKGETTVTEQKISTDIGIAPIHTAKAIEVHDTEKLIKLSKILNNSFSAYSTVIAFMSVAVFFFFERNRRTGLKMAFNIAVVILAILIPGTQILSDALIF